VGATVGATVGALGAVVGVCGTGVALLLQETASTRTARAKSVRKRGWILSCISITGHFG
jgi:hypothetical protein